MVLSIADEKKLTPQAKYDKNNTVSFSIKLNKNTDVDIIEKLRKVPSKQGYVKRCMRENIANEKE